MRFIIARGAGPTGTLLQELVLAQMKEDKVRDRDCIICYGAGRLETQTPTLNAHCSDMTKLEQAVRLQEQMPEESLAVFRPDQLEGVRWPGGVFLGRKTQHTQGKDIRIILEPWQVTAAVQAGTTFFTRYVSSEREFRVWVYRNRHLGTYEKALTRPAEFKTIGRNYHNGFSFQRIESNNVPEALKVIAKDAIRYLDLDFGAVDVLGTAEGYKVLEVNSAPGVQDDRRAVIQGLAHRIVRWMANDCPGR